MQDSSQNTENADATADADVATDADVDASNTSLAVVGSLPLSRILVTWVELTLVGFVGAALGSAISGPPRLVVFLATTLLSVAVLFYNVDRLVRDRLDG